MKNYTGIKFNKLTALNFVERKNKRTYWNFKCECGKEKVYSIDNLKTNNCKNCGCERKIKDLNKKNYSFLELLRNYKKSAFERGFEFNISTEDFEKLTKGNCYYCGIKPSKSIKIRSHNEYLYNGIDRKNNAIGYEIDNIVSCCEICNKAKRNLSIYDFENWISRLTKYQNNKI